MSKDKRSFFERLTGTMPENADNDMLEKIITTYQTAAPKKKILAEKKFTTLKTANWLLTCSKATMK